MAYGKLLQHYSQGKVIYYPLNKRLGDPKSWSEHCAWEKNLLSLHWEWNHDIQIIQCVT